MVKTKVQTLGLGLLLALWLTACQPIQALPAEQTSAAVSAETPVERANQAVVQRFYEEVVNQKKLAVFKEVFDPHMVEHKFCGHSQAASPQPSTRLSTRTHCLRLCS